MSMWSRLWGAVRGGGSEQRDATLSALGVVLRSQTSAPGPVAVTNDTALRHSAVWACLRVRADLISTLPCDTYRQIGGIQVEVPKAPILIDPGGEAWPYIHWMYATQFDLDRAGNTIGLITEKNALGLPARVELQPLTLCSVRRMKNDARHHYMIDGKRYQPEQVWHERQYPVAGPIPIGLSPVAYAAWSISEGLSMQQFILDWFAGGGVPKARLRNTKRSLESGPDTNEARRIKDRYKATVANGDIFVHGNDWELDFMQAEQVGTEWLEGRRATIGDVARYFSCPVDLIEAAISAPGSITYQSALQRNLQLLVINLGPPIARREHALSRALPRPRFVKLNTDALLRMDPETQIKVLDMEIKARIRTVTEARALRNLPPLTPEQEAEFARLFGVPRSAPEQPAARGQDGWPWEQVSPFSAAPYVPSDTSEVAL